MTMGFGLIGAGMIAPLHADALSNSSKANLVAIADLSRERAEALARAHAPDATVYDSVEALLADPAVEAVSISTPNDKHTDFVLAAAAAGKHVLCEKPPAMTLEETDRMIAACEAAGVRFGIFVQCRVRTGIRQIKSALDAGRFGRILRADAAMKWYRAIDYYRRDAWRSNRRAGAGVTIQHAFHYLDLLVHLAGPVQSVSARMRNLTHPDVELEDTLDAHLAFTGGAIGAVEASTGLWPGTDVRVEIFGERGAAIMEGATITLWQFAEEAPEDEMIRTGGASTDAVASSDPTALASGEHQFVYDDLVEAAREGREVVIPASAVRPTLEAALAMYKSDRTGAPVELPLDPAEDVFG